MDDDRTWVPLDECYAQFGYKSNRSALNAISADRFPVPTFKMGRRRAVDKAVIAKHFADIRQQQLAQMEDSP